MESPNMDGIGYAFALIALLILGAGFGFCKFIDWASNNDDIVSEIRIEPKIRLTITENKVDTLFIYEYRNDE